jgi:hypothetical protein
MSSMKDRAPKSFSLLIKNAVSTLIQEPKPFVLPTLCEFYKKDIVNAVKIVK